jgi:hypothetical protein
MFGNNLTRYQMNVQIILYAFHIIDLMNQYFVDLLLIFRYIAVVPGHSMVQGTSFA